MLFPVVVNGKGIGQAVRRKPELAAGHHNNIRLTKPRYLSQTPELIGSPKQIEKEYSLALAYAGAFYLAGRQSQTNLPLVPNALPAASTTHSLQPAEVEKCPT